MHLMRSSGGHFFTDDSFEPLLDAEAKWQPCEYTGGLPTNVTRTNEELVTCDFCLGWIFSERAKEVVAESCKHALNAIALIFLPMRLEKSSGY